jgi:tetratricopeptide (TPR) repeat protein
LEELGGFAKKNSGLAAAKAYSLSATIYDSQKKWELAEKAWAGAAAAAKKSYLAPAALYNAAVAAEEQGNDESAIGYYKKALEFGNSFIGAARAQFSVGRLEESKNNRDAALEAYRNLVSKWPSDPIWANLAHSRIIKLSE